MIAVTIPTTDVNSESATVVNWYVEDRAEVSSGQPLAEVETSKAIIDVVSPADGVVLRLCGEGDQVKIDQPLGQVFETLETLERYELSRSEAPPPSSEHAGRITAPARRRAAALELDIDEIAGSTSELVTAKLVDAYAARSDGAVDVDLPDPLSAPAGVRRLVIIGAGLGATQVLDILLHDAAQQAVAVVDDDRSRFGQQLEGVPVIGDVDRAAKLFAQGAFDAAVISISTSVPARTRLRERCAQAGIPLANVIDPSVRMASGVRIGGGNVLCAYVFIGNGAQLGDNNFISAYNSFDHHCELGSDISTGPGCMASGLVRLGDRCRLGTGIFIEPKVEVGAGAQIASGAVIVGSIPADHAVKTRTVTTTVVPIRPPR